MPERKYSARDLIELSKEFDELRNEGVNILSQIEDSLTGTNGVRRIINKGTNLKLDIFDTRIKVQVEFPKTGITDFHGEICIFYKLGKEFEKIEIPTIYYQEHGVIYIGKARNSPGRFVNYMFDNIIDLVLGNRSIPFKNIPKSEESNEG